MICSLFTARSRRAGCEDVRTALKAVATSLVRKSMAKNIQVRSCPKAAGAAPRPLSGVMAGVAPSRRQPNVLPQQRLWASLTFHTFHRQ